LTDFSPTRRAALTTLAGVAAATLTAPVHAQSAPWVVGIVRPYSGPLKGLAAGYVEALKALLDSVNAQGGVNGSKIELLEKDDEATPALTEKQMRAMADDPRVLALMGAIGTGNLLGAYPALVAGNLPMLAPYIGAPALHDAEHRLVFHVRASYEEEITEIVANIAQRMTGGKVLVLYSDDPFGTTGWNAFTRQMTAKGLRMPVTGLKFDRSTGAFSDPAAALAAIQQAEAVMMVATLKTGAIALKAVRADNKRATVYTLSVIDAMALVKEVGAPVAHGLMITQVMPNPRKSSLKLVRDYRALMDATKQPLNYAGLEGYVAGRVLLDALGRIKGAPSRDKLVAALEGLGRLDVGGFPLAYSRSSHDGSKFVDLTLVSASGSIID